MLTDTQKHDMLPLYRQALYHKDMARVAHGLKDFASERFHYNEYRRLRFETMVAGGFVKDNGNA